jgi:hypothetical protein
MSGSECQVDKSEAGTPNKQFGNIIRNSCVLTKIQTANLNRSSTTEPLHWTIRTKLYNKRETIKCVIFDEFQF